MKMPRLVFLALLPMLMLTGCKSGDNLVFDDNEIATGTGERTYSYESGQPKLIEDYADGELIRSRWYSPAGTLVYQTQWNRGTGTGIYLREDGSLHVRMEYKDGLADGPAVYYDEEGRITRIVEFRQGQPIAGD